MKCLDQQGLKYLWNLIKANFATNDEVTSKCGEVTSALTTQISNHTGNTDNPHNVTKAQLGLGEFDCEEGTWKPTCSALATIASYAATYVKLGNIVYCNFEIKGARKKGRNQFAIGGLPLPYPARRVEDEMAIGTMRCTTSVSPTDDRLGFTDSTGAENEQVIDVHLYSTTAIDGIFRKKYSKSFLPSYSENSEVEIKGTFVYRTT